MITGMLHRMLDAAHDELTTKPGRKILVPGRDSAWDDCCEGQLALRVINVLFEEGKGNCGNGVPWKIHAGLSIVRCAHTMDNQGRPPTSREVTGDAEEMLADMNELWTAIVCRFPAIPSVQRLNLERWTPLGPSGGCAGGEWLFNFLWLGCSCD